MSIFTQASTVTPESKIISTVQNGYNSYQNLLRQEVASLLSVWKNEDGLTPQQAIDVLGKDAVSAFQTSRLTVQFLAQVKAINQIPDTFLDKQLASLLAIVARYAIAENADGTVTVTPLTPAN